MMHITKAQQMHNLNTRCNTKVCADPHQGFLKSGTGTSSSVGRGHRSTQMVSQSQSIINSLTGKSSFF